VIMFRRGFRGMRNVQDALGQRWGDSHGVERRVGPTLIMMPSAREIEFFCITHHSGTGDRVDVDHTMTLT
jgi:hypothetical protein